MVKKYGKYFIHVSLFCSLMKISVMCHKNNFDTNIFLV